MVSQQPGSASGCAPEATDGTPALRKASQEGPVPLLTKQQRQILRWLSPGDRLWEIAEDPDHYTVYNEKRGRDRNYQDSGAPKQFLVQMFVHSEGQFFKFPQKNENCESVSGSENEILGA